MDSVGQRRKLNCTTVTILKLEVSPNLWAGVGLVRGGAGTALVGDLKPFAFAFRNMRTWVLILLFSQATRIWKSLFVAELVFPLLPFKTETGSTELDQSF